MMNKVILIAVVFSISACSVFDRSSKSPSSIFDFSQNITEESLHADLSVIAHDSLEGRDTGSEGLKKAALFLADKYESHGLQAVGDDGSYFQYFDLIQPTVDKIEYTVTSGDSVLDTSTHSNDRTANFITLFGGTDHLEGEIVFAGKGLFNEAEGINQFPDDVAGKWLMVFFDRGNTNMGHLQMSMSSGNALGVIMLTDTDVQDFNDEAENRKSAFGNSGRMSLAYQQEENGSETSSAFNRIHPELAATLLGVENIEALQEIETRIDSDPTAFKAKTLDYVLEHNPTVTENVITTKNVVAFLEGSDPELKNEVVVLSSHYDHVGIGRADSTGDALYNGADDDGSGTVATLQTALAMAAAKNAGVGPDRSVLFLHVSGEEKGLLGSRYYSDHPIYPIENTVANINIDMIGRVDEQHEQDSSYVYIIGGEIISSGLDSLTQVANNMGTDLNLSKRYNDLEDPNQFYRRSDHWNFGRLGVPFVFFFSGVHADYHRPSDEVDKITFEPYLKRTHLVYNLTALIANSDERPVVDNQEFIEKTQSQAR
ncbi:MAG: M28 family peptidase [Balneolaceae bacterium]